jgi:hypothetical protein
MASQIWAALAGGLLAVIGQIGNRVYDAWCRKRGLHSHLDSSLFRAGLRLQSNIQNATRAIRCFNTVRGAGHVSDEVRSLSTREAACLADDLVDPTQDIALADNLPQEYWSALYRLHACAKAVADVRRYTKAEWVDEQLRAQMLRTKLDFLLYKHTLTMLGVYHKSSSSALRRIWTPAEMEGVFRDFEEAGVVYDGWLNEWLSGEGRQAKSELDKYLHRA